MSLRLMPLGGSVTQGVGSSGRAGYRRLLREMLLSSSVEINMVGSRQTGSMPNNDHEGWRGFRIDEIDQKARKSVEKLLPNVFTVNAGSNDCLQDFKLDESGKRMGDMLDYLWQASPHSTILLSTLLVNANKEVDSRVMRVNDQFRDLVEKKAKEQKRILLVDMYSEQGPQSHHLVDGTHPDDEGYDLMAKLWLKGIQEALEKGFLH